MTSHSSFYTDEVCYVHLAKTGGNFVRHFLNKISDNLNRGSLPADEIWSGDRLSFSTIRNPLTFYVSWWNHNLRAKRQPYQNIVRSTFAETMNRLQEQDTGGADMHFPLANELDVGPFTIRVLGKFTDMIGKRSRRVACYTGPPLDSLTLNDLNIKYIIKMENLKHGLDELFSSLLKGYSQKQRDILFSIPKQNVGKYGAVSDHLTPAIAKWIQRKDRLIFRLFNYEETPCQ